MNECLEGSVVGFSDPMQEEDWAITCPFPIQQLPMELQYQILLHLDNESLISVTQVCHIWRELIDNPKVWEDRCKTKYLYIDQIEYDFNWKRIMCSNNSKTETDPKKLIDVAFKLFEAHKYDHIIEIYTFTLLKTTNISEKVLMYHNRSIAYQYDPKNIDKAIEDMTQAIQLRPQANYYRRRGFLYKSISRYNEALQDFTTAIKLDPTRGNYRARGFLYAKLGKIHEAIIDCNGALRLALMKQKEEHDAYNSRAWYYAMNREYHQCIEDATIALKYNPTYCYAFDTRGVGYQGLGRHENAIEDFKLAILHIEECCSSFVEHLHWAVSALCLNRYEESIEHLMVCARVATDYYEHVFAKGFLGITLSKINPNDPGCLQALNEAISAWEAHPEKMEFIQYESAYTVEQSLQQFYLCRATVYDILNNNQLAKADRCRLAEDPRFSLCSSSMYY